MTCFFLVLPKVSGRDNEQYVIAGWLLLLGLILWALTWFLNRAVYSKRTYMRDPDHLESDDIEGPRN